MTHRVPIGHPELEQIRSEFRNSGLQGWLWSWLTICLTNFVTIRLTRRYNPSLYSPSGQWDDEGVSGLVQDFIVHWGIERGSILAGLQRAMNTAGLVRYLEVSLFHYAVSQRRRTVRGNIFLRLSNLLASDPQLTRFPEAGRHVAYGLVEWFGASPERLADFEGSSLDAHLPKEIRRADYAVGDRNSPVISSEDLRVISRRLISRSKRLLTARQIMDAIGNRYDLGADDPVLSTSELAERSVGVGFEPLQDLVAEELARNAIGKLSVRQRAILREWLAGDPARVREIAARLSVGRTLVNQEQQEIRAVFRSLPISSQDERAQVLSKAVALLSR